MTSGRESTAETSPYFFLSHAGGRGLTPPPGLRRNRFVQRFQRDLGEQVLLAAHIGGGRTAGSGGPAVDADDQESERVFRELARCRTFVALYSEEYFSDRHCGRQWQAFAERLDVDEILRGRRAEAVIPVLWQPVPEDAMPRCARALRPATAGLGPAYLRHGLVYLLRHLTEYRAEYDSAVTALARRIVQAAEHASPAPTRPRDHRTVSDAFHRPGDPASRRPRVRIVVAAPCRPQLPAGAEPEMYGTGALDWKPYAPEYSGEIARAAERLAESMDFEAVVESAEDGPEFEADAPASAPVLLIIDPWAAQVPSLRRILRSFDEDSPGAPWVRPVVAWNRGHPANRAHERELETRIHAVLERCRRRRPDTPKALDGLETAREFIRELPSVIREAERFFLAEVGRRLSARPNPPTSAPRPRFHGPIPGLGGETIADPTNAEAER